MTGRLKSEYQRSYQVHRSRSESPQRRGPAPFAGLRSDHMGMVREPGLQRRRKLAHTCGPVLGPSEPQRPLAAAHRTPPPAASRSHSVHRVEPRPPTPQESEPGTPAAPRPRAEPEPPGRDSVKSAAVAAGSAKHRPSRSDDQSQPSRPLTADGRQPLTNEVKRALRWKAGLRSGGQRSGSEYERQFGWKKPLTSASPTLTAQRALYSSSSSTPPFKKHPVPVATEYQQNFQGVAPPTGPRLLRHLEQQKTPLFHTYKSNKMRREEPREKLRPKHQGDDIITTPPPQVARGHRTTYESSFRSPLFRIPEEGGATDDHAPQVVELRQQAAEYRHRAWGTNFSRDHMSQLTSRHNALWDSAPSPPTSEPHSRSTSCVDALDLASHSSGRSSVVGSVETHNTNRNTHTDTHTPPAESRSAWGEEEEEEAEESVDVDEGRLPTPCLRMRPVHRTHHDLTTPARGGAILVGTVKSSDDSSLNKHQRLGSAVSMATPPMEAWSERGRRLSPGPSHRPQESKPLRSKVTPPASADAPHQAPPLQAPPPLHGIQGMLRHPEFQHNGGRGSRFNTVPRSCDHEGDRLSVMSWRSAASCSAAAALLEHAQRRRDFWGKR